MACTWRGHSTRLKTAITDLPLQKRPFNKPASKLYIVSPGYEEGMKPAADFNITHGFIVFDTKQKVKLTKKMPQIPQKKTKPNFYCFLSEKLTAKDPLTKRIPPDRPKRSTKASELEVLGQPFPHPTDVVSFMDQRVAFFHHDVFMDFWHIAEILDIIMYITIISHALIVMLSSISLQ